MSVALRLAAFAAALALLLAGGALAGATLGPDRSDDEPAPDHAADAGHGAAEPATTTATNATATGDGHGGGHAGADDDGAKTDADAGAALPGLSLSDGGLQLALDTPELPRGKTEPLRFRILDEDGEVVRDFGVEHAKRMHVIVVRRDMTGFQHLHPRQLDDGSWTVPVRLDEAGSYRVFADFTRDGDATTLASDLRVDGPARLDPLPPPSDVARTGPYEVRLEAGDVRAGEETTLRFAITRDGQPVHVQRYLDADGHLVALRDGDLAYLHVHPEAHGDEEEAGAEHDDAIAFGATFPTAGRYRLFLQFRHENEIHTAELTQEVTR